MHLAKSDPLASFSLPSLVIRKREDGNSFSGLGARMVADRNSRAVGMQD
jgi:hypothetical protein